MRTLLGCLMCLVLTAAQGFAITGGPFGGGNISSFNLTGTYSGVFSPIVDPTVGLADNSLALYTLSVPSSGLATGDASIFRNGFHYGATIQALVDPRSAKLTGVIQGSFTDSAQVTNTGGIIIVTTSVPHNYYASGKFQNAKIALVSSSAVSGSVRVRGTASITYIPGPGFTPDPRGDSGTAVQYKVKGFKQS